MYLHKEIRLITGLIAASGLLWILEEQTAIGWLNALSVFILGIVSTYVLMHTNTPFIKRWLDLF